MSVTSQIPRKVSTAAPGATLFPYDFKVLSKFDMEVQVDGVTKTVDVDYTLTGVGLDAGGDITFLTPLAGGETVLRRRAMSYERANDFQQLGDLRSQTLNNDQDAPVMMIQQLAEALARCLQLPADSTSSAQLPAIQALMPLLGNAAGTGFEFGDTTLTGDMLLRGSLADADTPGRGAELVAFKQAGTGSLGRTLLAKLRELPVSVKDFGAAGNGTTVDNLAFLNAIAYAATNCREVLVPSGTYRLTANIQIPAGVSLVGEGAKPYTGPNSTTATPGNGSWLHFDHAGVGITVIGSTAASASSRIADIGTMRTHAAPGGGWTPTVYDYDILVQGVETFLDDVILLNAYKGVCINSSGYGRLWANRLRGQCFAEGINLEQSFDTCRLYGTHLWPYWSQHSAVVAWMLANTKHLRVARADNSEVMGFFGIYHNRGIEIYGTGDGTAYKLRMVNVDLDRGNDALVFETTADGASVDIVNFKTLGETGQTGNRGVRILGNNNKLNAVNVDVALVARDGVRVDGTGNSVRWTQSEVRFWNQAAVGASAYEVATGNLLEFGDRPRATDGGAGTMFGATAGVYKADLGAGVFSGSTNGSGDFTVTHNLGVQPSAVFLQGIATGSLQYSVQSVSSTQFTVRVYDAAGTPAASTSVNINWHAKKF